MLRSPRRHQIPATTMIACLIGPRMSVAIPRCSGEYMGVQPEWPCMIEPRGPNWNTRVREQKIRGAYRGPLMQYQEGSGELLESAR